MSIVMQQALKKHSRETCAQPFSLEAHRIATSALLVVALLLGSVCALAQREGERGLSVNESRYEIGQIPEIVYLWDEEICGDAAKLSEVPKPKRRADALDYLAREHGPFIDSELNKGREEADHAATLVCQKQLDVSHPGRK